MQKQPWKDKKSSNVYESCDIIGNKIPRKPANVNCFYDPNLKDNSRYLNNFSPKFENSPRSPKITTTFANDEGNLMERDCIADDDDDDDEDEQSNRVTSAGSSNSSFYQTPNSESRSPKQNSGFSPYSDCRNESARRSPQSPRKFVFDAISPGEHFSDKKISNKAHSRAPASDSLSWKNAVDCKSNKRENDRNIPIQSDLKPHLLASIAGNYSAKVGMNLGAKNKMGIGENVETFCDTQRYKIPNDNTISSRNILSKRDSCITDSTQFSGDSCETANTNITTPVSFKNSIRSPSGKNIDETLAQNSNSKKVQNVFDKNNLFEKCSKVNGQSSAMNRRHAINITSNPGYQILHSSHSTLDRTCSDSVVSMRCRKSTSDLTNIEVDDAAPPLVAKVRRRGSSKGGLAYLASRRSSRESIKSACSKTSVFSNEDVGPLVFKSSRSRQRRTSNFLELPIPDHIRPRVCSLPDRPYNPRVSDDLYRLRHFSISKGNVVNCGDSIISRRSRSNTSVNSTTSRASERSPFDGSCCGGGYANVDSMPPSPTESDEPPPPPRYRIVMLGDAGVGKTALVSQFMTSEYMHTYDASLDDEFGEKTVSILLDDEESELVFIDHPSVEMSVENSLSTYEPHACVVVYSIVDRNSFKIAEDTINYLWQENISKEKAVILVGNKADLARSRAITTSDGKNVAAMRDVKFIETSSGIQHNVDELLVGALKQIRLKEKRDKKKTTKMKTSRTHISLHFAKEILQKICLTDITKSKSCENLHVL